MKNKAVIPLYIILLVTLLIGTLFKIQHYPGAARLVTSGCVMEIFLVLLIFKEISSSAETSPSDKMVWYFSYGAMIILSIFQIFLQAKFLFLFWLLCLITGFIYIFAGRKVFVPKIRKIDKIKFDSF